MKFFPFFFPVLILLAFGIRATLAAQKLPTIPIFAAPDVRIEAELAYTDATRSRGLMFREKLAPDAGMLFVFPSLDIQSFWMKNTLISLDILWLNEHQKVVYMLTAQPCKKDPCDSIVPLQKALYVLEVNAGFARKHNIDIGTQFEFVIPEEIMKRVK
jgi:uncharacterized membrane protein (UPF0127 family)